MSKDVKTGPVWLPSQQFLIVGAADWLLIAAAFTLVQRGAVATHTLLYVMGILIAVAGLARDRLAEIVESADRA